MGNRPEGLIPNVEEEEVIWNQIISYPSYGLETLYKKIVMAYFKATS
jgi:hypothetical protein